MLDGERNTSTEDGPYAELTRQKGLYLRHGRRDLSRSQLLPGVREFVSWLNENGKQFLFLTNSSERSPKELRQKLQRMGLDIGEEHFYTSALATAAFLKKQARLHRVRDRRAGS